MSRRILAVVIAAGVLTGCSSPAKDDASSTPAPYTTSATGVLAAAQERLDGAYDFCIEKITDRLKAPSTAQFSARDRDHEAHDGDTYYFTGTVDSENGFGAMLRSEFGCEIRWTGSEYEAVTVSVE